MKASNIQGAWAGAGLILFNPHKVIRRIKTTLSEEETAHLISPLSNDSNNSYAQKFSLIPCTPSKVDSANLRSADEAFGCNIWAGIFDTQRRNIFSNYLPSIFNIKPSILLANTIIIV